MTVSDYPWLPVVFSYGLLVAAAHVLALHCLRATLQATERKLRRTAFR